MPMSPVRLVILSFLFYIAWRLIRNMVGKKPPASDAGRKETSGVEDVLVEDPVCHTLLPKHQAIRLRRNEKTYYFCSEKCCDTFTRDSGGEK